MAATSELASGAGGGGGGIVAAANTGGGGGGVLGVPPFQSRRKRTRNRTRAIRKAISLITSSARSWSRIAWGSGRRCGCRGVAALASIDGDHAAGAVRPVAIRFILSGEENKSEGQFLR